MSVGNLVDGGSSADALDDSFGAIPEAGGGDGLAIAAAQQDGGDGADFRIAEVSQGGVGPAFVDFDAAGKHVDDGGTAGGKPDVQALDEACAWPGLEELDLAGQVIGVVVGLVMNDEKFAIGRPVFQDGNQGVVQRLLIAQDRNDDRQPKHGKGSWVAATV